MRDGTETAPADKLLPCPFCGNDASIIEGGGRFFASCSTCYCCVGEAYDRDAMPDHLFVSAEDAAAAWNHRIMRPSGVEEEVERG